MMRLCTLVTLMVAGCSLNEFTVNSTAPVMKIASQSFNEESDLQLAHDAIPAQLKTADGFLAASPKNMNLLEVVSQGYAEYAFGFLEDELEALPDDEKHTAERQTLTRRATGLYDRALAYALRYLVQCDKGFPAAFKKDLDATNAAAQRLKKDAVPGLFLAALSLASAINLNRDDLTRVVELPKAIALLKRVHELDPKFYNGGAAMSLGVVYSAQGKAMGGDPEGAKKLFEEADAVSGGKYLMTKVMMAKSYAVIVQDRALYESTLKAVLAAPPDLWPEQRLANELAKRRAARYLAHVEDYF
jgi:hypothetical protein